MAKLWKQPRWSTTDEWIKKMYLYSMGFYSVIKKNKVLLFTGKWMELEIISSEVSQFKKTKVACFLSYEEDRHNTNTNTIIFTYNYI
jgi:hypothetical protein